MERIEADLDIAAIIDLAIVILIVTVIIVFGGTFTEDMREDLPTRPVFNLTNNNATTQEIAPEIELALNQSQTAFFKIPKKLGILVSAILFAIVISVIVKYVWFANRGTVGGI